MASQQLALFLAAYEHADADEGRINGVPECVREAESDSELITSGSSGRKVTLPFDFKETVVVPKEVTNLLE